MRLPRRGRGGWAALAVERWAAISALVAIGVPDGPAGARERPQVAVSIDDCVAAPREQVRHLLSLELGSPLADGQTSPGTTRATVTCAAPPSSPPGAGSDALQGPEAAPPPPSPGELVELRVDDGVTGKSLWRSVELHPADPGVRARLLSLALSELIFASWAELLVTPQPAVPAAAPAASAATRQATSVQVERKLSPALPPLGVQLAGLGALQVMGRDPTVAYGGGLRVTGEHRYHLGWDVDVLFHHGETATALGTIKTDLLSARTALLLHYRVPRLILRGGLGGRVGAARLAGQPTDAKTTLAATLWGPWAGPLLTLGLSAAAARVRLDLSFEGGYVLAPVAARVGGVRTVSVSGPWLGVQLGIGSFLR